MTVKVVSEGPVRTKQVVCSKCCFKLEYTGVDVKSYTGTDYGGGTDTSYYIDCPKCGDSVYVSYWGRSSF